LRVRYLAGIPAGNRHMVCLEKYAETNRIGTLLMSWDSSSLNKSFASSPSCPRKRAGHPEVFQIPGFRLALAIASLAGMTFELSSEPNNTLAAASKPILGEVF
jgi:hypothetical protein